MKKLIIIIPVFGLLILLIARKDFPDQMSTSQLVSRDLTTSEIQGNRLTSKLAIPQKEDLEDNSIELIKSKNLKTYFKMVKLKNLDKEGIDSFLNRTPEELKKEAKLNIKKALINHLKDKKLL